MKIKEAANKRIAAFAEALILNGNSRPTGELYAGVDLGTAYIVTAVVDSQGTPVAGVLTRSESSVRDGLVLDYVGAIAILRRQLQRLRQAGLAVGLAKAAYPPGTTGRNASAFGNVLTAVGLEVQGLIDEPTAAALVLEITDGAVVDIGGGTTGISVLENGAVIYTADEPTGGVHLDLVLAGHFRMELAEAERLKRDSSRQTELFPLLRPVFQKMATIVRQHLQGHQVETIYLVGGTSSFPGIEGVMEEETGLPVVRPTSPLLVTPLGIALSCLQSAGRAE
ncbi:MAG: ethanolamine utilization protein EutJ [Deltaproteobacteria bacterium]|nr:ethanolamine utilization protein EutJ [Deltaproteobacteria bacterium]MBW2069783.1 ethanolamine utilization protein EutJ [Deltaproteobacteria bacterium]